MAALLRLRPAVQGLAAPLKKALVRAALRSLILPPPFRSLILVPVTMMTAIQVVTGLPSPEYFAYRPGPALIETLSQGAFSIPETLRNLSHVPMFGVLAWSYLWSLCVWIDRRTTKNFVATAVATAFGALNELSQVLIPGRIVSLSDLLLNLLGIFLALLLFLVLSRQLEATGPAVATHEKA